MLKNKGNPKGNCSLLFDLWTSSFKEGQEKNVPKWEQMGDPFVPTAQISNKLSLGTITVSGVSET